MSEKESAPESSPSRAVGISAFPSSSPCSRPFPLCGINEGPVGPSDAAKCSTHLSGLPSTFLSHSISSNNVSIKLELCLLNKKCYFYFLLSFISKNYLINVYCFLFKSYFAVYGFFPSAPLPRRGKKKKTLSCSWIHRIVCSEKIHILFNCFF